MLRFFSIWFFLATSSVASAQSRPTLRRAERALAQTDDRERLRESFKALSDELRDQPDTATAEGWWVRGDTAAALVTGADNPATMSTVALDSYNEALNLGRPAHADLRGLKRIEAALLPLAEDLSDGETAWEANEQLLIALEVRRRLEELGGPALDPVHNVRIHAKSVEAALATGRTKEARKLFLDLEAAGGFLERPALAIARRLREEQGPQAEFLFLTLLLERHANRRKLLIRYIEVCAENSWFDEAHEGLSRAIPHLADTYEDQLFIARNLELLQRPEEAQTRYQKALQHAPRGFEANLRYASLLAQMAHDAGQEHASGEEEDEVPPTVVAHQRRALDALELALEANPENPDALALAAELYRALEDETSLEQVEKKLADLYPQD